MEINKIIQFPELKAEYNREQAERSWKINRIVAPISILFPVILILFSDRINFPYLYHKMFLGRMYAIVLGMIVIFFSLIPRFKNHGQFFSFLLFLGFNLMAAHLSGVMNNDNSVLLYWVFASVIGCGLLPLALPYTIAVVVLSFAYYLIIYFSSGFLPDISFRMTIINVGSASIVAMAFKAAQARIQEREFLFRRGLTRANEEIEKLNDKLKDENIHLNMELEVAKHIQTLVLPQKDDYHDFVDLNISCLMIPADEVGGDYFDTISFGDSGIITIGDVTDHGLHSGLIMMMVHTAIRVLSQIERNDIEKIFKIINKLLYDFRYKTSDHRIMTLIILKYLGNGMFLLTGQHESLLIISKDGSVQDISSLDYGMFAGLEADVEEYTNTLQFEIKNDDVLILYTDGLTEAMDNKNREFGKTGIINAVLPVRGETPDIIKTATIKACLAHIGNEKIYDDISLLVIKKNKERL